MNWWMIIGGISIIYGLGQAVVFICVEEKRMALWIWPALLLFASMVISLIFFAVYLITLGLGVIGT